ncbi:MAG: sugar ABC transporter ATP-binding protein [Actinobacteria bacterium]|nr:sugar ABC transporter ATP-binding protein [Actinomycetota bacterium]
MECNAVKKSFGNVNALKGATISARPGEVTAIVGDNGAGKTTLIKCIAGVYQPDEGEIRINGESVTFDSPESARVAGIETVYQNLSLVEDLTIWQNLFLNREITKNLGVVKILNRAKMREESEAMLKNLDVYIPSVRSRTRGLSGGQRQAVAICRAVGWGSKVVIMDEPTAALGARETMKVEELIKKMKAQGLAILLISHNFEQVLRLSDHIFVMRQGDVIAGMRTKDTTGDELVALITGSAKRG